MEPKLIEGGLYIDDRGELRAANDFSFYNVQRFYQVENHCTGTIRAWHGHKHEGKYVYVAQGTAIIGAVKLPDEPATCLSQYTAQRFVMSAKKPQILWIPPGYANGSMSLDADTIIMYFSTAKLEESKSDDIRFNWLTWDIWDVEWR
jgi:dTDP-4-dehydrorhamnose 3,5-epimerase